MSASNYSKIGFSAAISIVIANMVGTGVFTSLGFQVMGIQSYFPLLVLWAIGGVVALAGALTYGELAVAMPESGGEYQYLSRLYHPLVGFLSGWVSITVGFAAPTALAAMALGRYMQSVFLQVDAPLLSLAVVAIVTAIHCLNIRTGAAFQVFFSGIKVLLLVAFIGAGLFLTPVDSISVMPVKGDWDLLTSPAFALSLIYVSYAYSGWNAAIYLSGDIANPKKNLPRALISGTIIVALLYLGLNYVFLRSTPLSALEGQVEVGYLAAGNIFGPIGGKAMGMLIALLLVSTVSAMIIAGPRVSKTMGEDLVALKFLAKTSSKGIPVRAILLQSLITAGLILTASFEQVLTYAGFTLSLFSFLAVLGVFILRKRKLSTGGYRTWGYPVTPIIFLALSLWTMIFLLKDQPRESMAGLATVTLGMVLYFGNQWATKRNASVAPEISISEPNPAS
jgi:APA family basic amino acid/polyamine antiporter